MATRSKKPIQPVKKSNVKKPLLAIAILVVIAIIATFVFVKLHKANPTSNITSNQSIMSAAGKLLQLPQNETPSIATVLDATKLKGQPFFLNAKNGDKLLVYKTAMQAILYRPSTNKIIQVASVVNDQENNTTAQNAPSASTIKIAYYNGTAITGFAKTTEQTVMAKFPNYQTALTTNAAQKNYKENLIIDITGSHSQAITDLSALIGGKAGTLPASEKKPDADILIILGK